MFTVTVDLGEFRQAARRTTNQIVTACYDSAADAARAGRDEAKAVGSFQDQTGQLRGTIRAQHGSLTATGGTWEIVAPKAYALYVEAGTRPHRIEARGSGFLRFEIGGRVFYRRSVQHPGTHAYAFMGPAHLKAEAVLQARLEASLARIAASWD